MKWSAVAIAMAGAAAAKAPTSPAPAGCQKSTDGKFEVTIYSLGDQKRELARRGDCTNANNLVLQLKDGVLTDAKGRIGSIVANYQFQFDGPPAQAGAIYDSGFSLCGNGSLALGGSTTFYRCLSGSFYNLYDRHWAAQCSPIELAAMPCGGGSTGGSGGNAGGKPVGTQMVPTTIVTAIGDGQPQVHTTVVPVPMCAVGGQIGDGQVQAHTTPCAAITQIGDGQVQAPTNAPAVSQISDGQLQAPPTAPPAPPVSQIGDGQPQGHTGSPVSQIGDGQPQGHTGAPVSQIGDGQPQGHTGAPVSQIGDGQPQAPTGPAVTQIGDGQPQAGNGTAPAPTKGPTAGAGKVFPGVVAAAVAIFGAALAL